MSKGEDKIIDILNKENLNYIREKTFEDLKGGTLRYDFYLPNYNGEEIIIEFNGAQHYFYTNFFYKKKTDMQKAQERDRRKISYCLAKGIKIYEIPYWDLPKIKKIEDLFANEYQAKSRWHNDYVYRQQLSH